MSMVSESAAVDHDDEGLLALHISQVPEDVGLIRVVKDLANQNREIETDGSWSRKEILRLSKEYPQLVVELQVTPEEKLNLLLEQLTDTIEKKLTLERMFENVNAVKERLKERIKEVFDDQIIAFRNKMTMVSYGVSNSILTENATSYSKLISYSTECFVIGILFAEYLGELSTTQKNTFGKSLILHKIGYIETLEDSTSLLERTVAILKNAGCESAIIHFAKNHGMTRFKDGKLKNLLRATEIGKIVTFYCNCTVNHPNSTPAYKTIQNFEKILDTSGRRREIMFEPTLLTKFVEMMRKGLEMPMY